MTIEEEIETLLFAKAKALLLSEALPIVWPNDVSEAHGQKYIRIQHLPNENVRLFQGSSDPHRRNGIFQLTVVRPLNEGSMPARKLSGEVAQHFAADTILSGTAFNVKLTKAPTVHSSLNTDVAYETPISVYYSAFA